MQAMIGAPSLRLGGLAALLLIGAVASPVGGAATSIAARGVRGWSAGLQGSAMAGRAGSLRLRGGSPRKKLSVRPLCTLHFPKAAWDVADFWHFCPTGTSRDPPRTPSHPAPPGPSAHNTRSGKGGCFCPASTAHHPIHSRAPIFSPCPKIRTIQERRATLAGEVLAHDFLLAQHLTLT